MRSIAHGVQTWRANRCTPVFPGRIYADGARQAHAFDWSHGSSPCLAERCMKAGVDGKRLGNVDLHVVDVDAVPRLEPVTSQIYVLSVAAVFDRDQQKPTH